MKRYLALFSLFFLFFLFSCEKEKTYTVNFIGPDWFSSKTYKEGDLIEYPTCLDYEGYHFIRWNRDDIYCYENLDIVAIYEINQYEVKFVDSFGNIIEERLINHGSDIEYPEPKNIKNYTFSKWDKQIDVCFKNEVITALYEESKYKVTFIDQWGTVIDEQFVYSNEEIIYPEAPSKTGFMFVSWSDEIAFTEEDVEIVAYYNILQFKVTFRGLNNALIDNKTVNYDMQFVYPVPPTIEGYTFKGWDKEVLSVTENTTINAIYEKNLYKVSFLLPDGSLIQTVDVYYNDQLEYPLPVEISGFEFVGWDKTIDKVTRNETIYALYEEIILTYSNYSSYIETLNLENPAPLSSFINTVDLTNNQISTVSGIVYGGFRGENQIHCYDASNYRSRNSYGHEIAVNSSGIVIDSNTLVELPEDGFIISGHNKGGNTLKNSIGVGDYVIYNKEEGSLKIYRNNELSMVVLINERILKAKEIIKTSYDNLIPLDYQKIVLLYNESLIDFSNLLNNYNQTDALNLSKKVVEVHFRTLDMPAVKTKAFWHYQNRVSGYAENNVESVRSFLDKVDEAGFNTIYLLTNFNGGCLYTSDYLTNIRTASNRYDGYKDYLECFIEEAHLRGLKVFAWTTTFICGDGYLPNHVDKSLVSIDYQGKNNYGNMYFYDITRIEVQNLLENVYYELAKNYNLDGIELDFIRYPSSNLYSYSGTISNPNQIEDFCFTENAITKFKEKYSITQDVKQLLLTDQNIRDKWLEFKISNVTYMVELITNAIKRANPNTLRTAAVMTSLSGAKRTYAQDFGFWVELGYIDMLEPMNYTGSVSSFESRVSSFCDEIDSNALITMGMSPDGSGGDVITYVEQLAVISKYEIGFSEFSSKRFFTNVDLMNGMKAIKRDYSTTVLDDESFILTSYLKRTLDLVNNYFSFVSTIDVDSINQTCDDVYHKDSKLIELKALFEGIQNQTVKSYLLNELNYIIKLIGE